MKKIIGIILAVTFCIGIFTGCTENDSVQSYGGSSTIKLPPNTKLIDVEWEEDDLWYMTRPMREDEIAETYSFRESSSYGVMEGCVTIVETN